MPGRFMHTAALYEPPAGAFMVVFGGIDQNDAVLDDCWAIAVGPASTFQCSPLRHHGFVKPRASHTAVVWDNGMWVFGGMDELYGWKEFRVQAAFDVLDMNTLLWKPVPAAGTVPCPRMDHSCRVWNQQMLLFGGSHNDRAHFLNDLHSFDFFTFTWTQIVITSPCPSPRVGVGMVVHDNRMLVFGGRLPGSQYVDDLLVFDLLRRKWYSCLDAGRRPSIRWLPLAEEVNGFLYITGGSKRKSGLVSRHTDCRKIRIADLQLKEFDSVGGAIGGFPQLGLMTPERLPAATNTTTTTAATTTSSSSVASKAGPAEGEDGGPLSLSLVEVESRLRGRRQCIADAEALVQRALRKIAEWKEEVEALEGQRRLLRERGDDVVSNGEAAEERAPKPERSPPEEEEGTAWDGNWEETWDNAPAEDDASGGWQRVEADDWRWTPSTNRPPRSWQAETNSDQWLGEETSASGGRDVGRTGRRPPAGPVSPATWGKRGASRGWMGGDTGQRPPSRTAPSTHGDALPSTTWGEPRLPHKWTAGSGQRTVQPQLLPNQQGAVAWPRREKWSVPSGQW
eukprot:GGOE01043305.1.p1 GENE.GGOE01043305.1~~GGOE01043305.1.p1  ORF type:complete len:665 (-),score=121.59 GGOE01043305.1:56-1753(-)